MDSEFGSGLGIAAIILALALGVSTCRYVDHRIDVEKTELTRKAPQ